MTSGVCGVRFCACTSASYRALTTTLLSCAAAFPHFIALMLCLHFAMFCLHIAMPLESLSHQPDPTLCRAGTVTDKSPTKHIMKFSPPAALIPSKRCCTGLCPLHAILKYRPPSPPLATFTATAFTTIAISNRIRGALVLFRLKRRCHCHAAASGVVPAPRFTRKHAPSPLLPLVLVSLPSTFPVWRDTTARALLCLFG
jgi:hypothetical protein